MVENKHISVVVPLYNESENFPELYRRLSTTVGQISNSYELVFVNDGSSDNTLRLIKDATQNDSHVFYINFSRNFGHQIAVTAGLEKCRGDVVVIMDGDLQDPPEVIPKLYEKYREGYQVVYAQREKRQGESWLKKVTANVFYRILQQLTSIHIPVDTGDFRLIDRTVVHNLNSMQEHNKFLRGQIAWLGYKQAAVLFTRNERTYGKTGYSYAKMFRFAMDGITGFSDKPLQFVTKLGFLFSFISFIVIIYALFSYFILNRVVTGWTSLIVSTMFIGGVQLVSIGILGQYISRIMDNVRKRPLYIIEDTNLD